MKHKLILNTLWIAFSVLLVAAVFSILCILNYGKTHGGLIWGLPEATLIIAVLTASISLFSLTLTLLKYKSPKRTVNSAGIFPKNILRITEVVEGAKPNSDLLIMADSPDYGSLGSFEDHQELLQQMKNARKRGVRVLFLLLGPPAAVSKSSPMRNFRKDFERFSHSEPFHRFFRTHLPGLKEPKTANEFEQTMMAYMTRVIEDLKTSGIQIYQIPPEQADQIPFFLWSAGSEAVIVNLDTGKSTVLTDREVIRTYENLFKRQWNLAQALC